MRRVRDFLKSNVQQHPQVFPEHSLTYQRSEKSPYALLVEPETPNHPKRLFTLLLNYFLPD